MLFSQRRQLAKAVDRFLDDLDRELNQNRENKISVTRDSMGVVTALCVMGWLRAKPKKK